MKSYIIILSLVFYTVMGILAYTVASNTIKAGVCILDSDIRTSEW